MKKMMMLGLMAMAASSADANQAAPAKAEAQQVALSNDEQAFVAKLSDTHRTTFNQMSVEQRAAVLAAANDAASADAAVEKVAAEKK